MSVKPRVKDRKFWLEHAGVYNALIGWGEVQLHRRECEDDTVVPQLDESLRAGRRGKKAPTPSVPTHLVASVLIMAKQVDGIVGKGCQRELLEYVFVDGWEYREALLVYTLTDGKAVVRSPGEPPPGRYDRLQYVHRRRFVYVEEMFDRGRFAAINPTKREVHFKLILQELASRIGDVIGLKGAKD